jgi:hypothetical protein
MWHALPAPRDQFAPFLLPEDESADPEDYYEQYCDTLETTAGGRVGLVREREDMCICLV